MTEDMEAKMIGALVDAIDRNGRDLNSSLQKLIEDVKVIEGRFEGIDYSVNGLRSNIRELRDAVEELKQNS